MSEPVVLRVQPVKEDPVIVVVYYNGREATCEMERGEATPERVAMAARQGWEGHLRDAERKAREDRSDG